MNTDKTSKHKALPFKARMLEVHYQANPHFCHPKVIQHLAALMICYLMNDLWIDNDRVENDQVRNELTNFFIEEKNAESALLIEGNFFAPECNRQPVFINLFMKTVSHSVEDVKCATENHFRLFYIEEL